MLKKTSLLLSVIGLSFLLLPCCKKKENNGPASIVWRATVNGVPDSGTSISAVYASVSTHLTISLFPSDTALYPDILFTGRSIGNAVIDTGIYAVDGTNPYFTAEYDSSVGIVYYAASGGTGQLYLSKFDTVAKVVSGTFHFTAHNSAYPQLDSVVITNGSFTNISLLVQ